MFTLLSLTFSFSRQEYCVIRAKDRVILLTLCYVWTPLKDLKELFINKCRYVYVASVFHGLGHILVKCESEWNVSRLYNTGQLYKLFVIRCYIANNTSPSVSNFKSSKSRHLKLQAASACIHILHCVSVTCCLTTAWIKLLIPPSSQQ